MDKIRNLMNKTSWGWIVAVCMVPLAIIGCAKAETNEPERNLYVLNDRIYVFTDPDTGCQYLSKGSYSSLTPRTAADGKTHMGCGTKP